MLDKVLAESFINLNDTLEPKIARGPASRGL